MTTTALVIDDDPIIADIFEAVLCSDDYTVYRCESAAKAVDSAIWLNPDIIFIDLYMPELDGLQIANALSEAGVKALTMFVSGSDRQEDIKAMSETAELGLIRKPLDVDKLREALSTVKLIVQLDKRIKAEE